MSNSSQDVYTSAVANISWRIRIWLQSFRLKFLPQGVMPVFLGSIIAWIQTGRFDLGLFLLTFIGCACVQIGLTMLNDTLDYIYGTDRSDVSEKNPFSGGSGVLVQGLLQPSETFSAVIFFYLSAAVIGSYLAIQSGFGIFWIAIFGGFLSIFYSAKPLRFAHRGIGELAMLVGYGPTITLGAAYVQTGEFLLLAAFAGLIPGLMMWSMILLNEIPDYHEDIWVNKLTITVRLGPKVTRWVYAVSLVGVYLFIIAGVYIGIFPVWVMLSWVSIPIAFHSIRVTFKKFHSPKAMTPANRAMVQTYGLTMLFFCTGYWLSAIL